MDELLSKKELKILTGYSQNKKIIEWLKKNHITFMLDGRGTPKVHRQTIAHSMGVPTDKPKKELVLDFNQKGFKL